MLFWRKGYNRIWRRMPLRPISGFVASLRSEAIESVVICGIATNSAASSPPGTCGTGFAVSIVEDASAGIDVPAAGLFQETAKAEGIEIGIRYVRVDEVALTD